MTLVPMFTLLAATLTSGQSDECSAVPRALLQEPRVPFDETYTNKTWGFAVSIPRGMTAYSQSSPPYHGVWFVLGDPPHGSIVMSGEANSLEFKTPRAAALDQSRMLREEVKQVKSSSISTTRLAGLPAARVETTYRCKGDPQTYLEVHVLVIRSRQDPVYDIVLVTTVDHAREDRAVFDRVLRNWQFIGR